RGAKQAPAAERQRHQNSGASLGRCRQDAVLCLPVVDRIVDLEKVGLGAPNDSFHGAIASFEGRRYPGVAADAARLESIDLRHVLARVAHIMELEQVKLSGLEPLQTFACFAFYAAGPVFF